MWNQDLHSCKDKQCNSSPSFGILSAVTLIKVLDSSDSKEVKPARGRLALVMYTCIC